MAEPGGGRRRLWGLGGPARLKAGAETGLEASFLHLFEAAPDGQALLDAEGRILLANPALAQMTGPAVPPRRGLPAAHLLAPAAWPALAARLAAALAGTPEPSPLLAAPADPAAPPDTEWALRCGGLPLRGGGQPRRLLLHVRDHSEQRRAAARLAAATRLETVGQLTGGIAHDFNNLLGAVLGAAEGMRAAGLDEAAAAELGTIEDAARRGAALVRQLLAFARQQQLQPRVLDLNAAVEGLAPLLRRLTGRGVRVELALETPGRLVRVDPTQLDQVLLNLAANAREAMPEGGTLRIATGRAVVLRFEGEGPQALPPGRYAVLEVSDTGTGISPEALPRLFEPFFTTRPDRGGTGLGLATVQGIVAQSGGHIAVTSRLGEGTTFRIHLPRHEAKDVPEAPAPERAAAAATRGAPRAAEPLAAGGRILLVEDEAALRRVAERLLARAGHAVVAADSAEAALELMEGGPPPDALVSDVAMPGADGLALARRLRARWPGLPVLLLSGYAEATLDEDLEAQGIHFLAKPFEPAALVAAVAALAGVAGTPAAGG